MKLDDFYRFECRTTVRVHYRDTDQMGVVYYANHLVWFEIGRTELIRELGLPYRELEARGVFLPVVSVRVDYRSPARYDDLIEIQTRATRMSKVSIEFAYTLVRREANGPVVIAEGATRHAFVDRNGKVIRDAFAVLGIER